jgi:hypothetical protein
VAGFARDAKDLHGFSGDLERRGVCRPRGDAGATSRASRLFARARNRDRCEVVRADAHVVRKDGYVDRRTAVDGRGVAGRTDPPFSELDSEGRAVLFTEIGGVQIRRELDAERVSARRRHPEVPGALVGAARMDVDGSEFLLIDPDDGDVVVGTAPVIENPQGDSCAG